MAHETYGSILEVWKIVGNLLMQLRYILGWKSQTSHRMQAKTEEYHKNIKIFDIHVGYNPCTLLSYGNV